jgi:hypothetical protein
MMRASDWLRNPGTVDWAILIRLNLAFVFIREGYQKLAFQEILGAGRLAKIGIPYADQMGPFVGVVEFTCGGLFLVGGFTPAAVVPLIIIMRVALLTTKVPILLVQDWGIFKVRDLDRYGFLSMTHEAHGRGEVDGPHAVPGACQWMPLPKASGPPPNWAARVVELRARACGVRSATRHPTSVKL